MTKKAETKKPVSFFLRASQEAGKPMEAVIQKQDKKYMLYADPKTREIEVFNITTRNKVGKTRVAKGEFKLKRTAKRNVPQLDGYVTGLLGTSAILGWLHDENPADLYYAIQFKKARQGQLALPPGA